MDNNEWEDLDKIMRYLYKKRSSEEWYTLYTNLGMDRSYANSLYEIAEAEGHLQVDHKGMRFDVPDAHYVKLTPNGLSFFAKTNYTNEHLKRIATPSSSVTNNTNIINSSNSTVITGNDNTASYSNNKKGRENLLTNPWLVTIVGGLLIAILIYLINKYFELSL